MPSATIKIVSKNFMEILQEETLNRTRVEEEIYTLYVCMCFLLLTNKSHQLISKAIYRSICGHLATKGEKYLNYS